MVLMRQQERVCCLCVCLYYYYVLLAPISRGTPPCAMHGHAPWLLAGSLHSSPAGAFAGTPRNVLCPLQSVECGALYAAPVFGGGPGFPPLSKLDPSAQMHGFPNTPLWVCRRGLACFSVLSKQADDSS